MVELSTIKTEENNDKTLNIDKLNTIDIAKLINDEDKIVAYAVEQELESISLAADLIYHGIKNGGRLVYLGAGTSGRLGVLDAVECPPTYGTNPDLVQGIIAGGSGAIVKAVEGAEDNENQAEIDLKEINFHKNDVLVGIAASGRTPYVIGGITYAKTIGAKTISVTCCPGSILNQLTEVSIAPNTGPEVITGSTRMKAGTAQKLVLNMLSTITMIKLGKVYGNLMIDVKATNEKLMERTVSIVCEVTGVSNEKAREVLELCDNSAKIGIVMIQYNLSKEDAEELLVLAQNRISEIESIRKIVYTKADT